MGEPKPSNSVLFFGLLFYEDENVDQNIVNLSPKYKEEQFRILVSNAVNLSRSLRLQGLNFVLITNRKDVVMSYSFAEELDVDEITFDLEVPKGISFYSAHHKLDVYKYLSQKEDGYYVFCDVDMMCINPIPQSLLFNVAQGIPLAYDISDQVIPTNGEVRIISDMTRLSGGPVEARWYGGEFLSGTPVFFKSLYEEVRKLLPAYFEQISTFHHVGDEMIVSTALQNLSRQGVHFRDAGTLGIVNRFWSIKTMHPQKSFGYNRDVFLVHLPADKVFLSNLLSKSIHSVEEYFLSYQKYIFSLAFRFRKRYQEFKKSLKSR